MNYYHCDHECISCGAHWMQTYTCTQEEINQAENKYLRFKEQMEKEENE